MLDVWVMIGLTVPSLCYAIMAFMWFGLNEGAAIIAIAVTGITAVVFGGYTAAARLIASGQSISTTGITKAEALV